LNVETAAAAKKKCFSLSTETVSDWCETMARMNQLYLMARSNQNDLPPLVSTYLMRLVAFAVEE
jgi:hypothetical protein